MWFKQITSAFWSAGAVTYPWLSLTLGLPSSSLTVHVMFLVYVRLWQLTMGDLLFIVLHWIFAGHCSYKERLAAFMNLHVALSVYWKHWMRVVGCAMVFFTLVDLDLRSYPLRSLPVATLIFTKDLVPVKTMWPLELKEMWLITAQIQLYAYGHKVYVCFS